MKNHRSPKLSKPDTHCTCVDCRGWAFFKPSIRYEFASRKYRFQLMICCDTFYKRDLPHMDLKFNPKGPMLSNFNSVDLCPNIQGRIQRHSNLNLRLIRNFLSRYPREAQTRNKCFMNVCCLSDPGERFKNPAHACSTLAGREQCSCFI